MDLWMTLRYIGININAKSYMFGDNQGVVTNSTMPHSTWSKQLNALAYHYVCKMIDAQIWEYYWIDGKQILQIL
jgi:hypothetical protein